LEKCEENAKDLKKLKDPAFGWLNCYGKLISNIDQMEETIKDEFNNYI
jgi:hypothetical protein